MPPRAKKRARMGPTPCYTSDTESRPIASTTFSDVPSLPLARKGFLALPNELIYEILSHYPEITTEHCLMHYGRFLNEHKNPPNFFERFNVLRALSQTCRYSRQIYLPLLWERFQVSLATKPEGSWFREFGEAMERKSQGLLDSKYLWPYVRVVTVTLTRFQPKKVLPPFVQLLRTLPNVHTLEIRHAHSEMTTILREAFEGSLFPTIERVLLPSCAHEILRCCPSVREVTCREDDGGKLVGALIRGGCSKLEVLRGIAPGRYMMKRLSKKCPQLRSIRIITKLGGPSIAPSIEACSNFPSLHIIEIDWDQRMTDGDHPQLIKLASDALRACAEHKPISKTKKVRNSSNSADIPGSAPQSLHPDVRVVRVRHLPRPSYISESASHHIPERVEEFPVDVRAPVG